MGAIWAVSACEEDAAGVGSENVNARERILARVRAAMAAEPRVLTQAELARRTGMSPAWVSQFLRGKIDGTLETADKLAALLRIDVADLLRPENAPEPQDTDQFLDTGTKVATLSEVAFRNAVYRAEDSDLDYDLFERSLHIAMHAVYKEYGRDGLWPVKVAIDEALHGPKSLRRQPGDGAQKIKP